MEISKLLHSLCLFLFWGHECDASESAPWTTTFWKFYRLCKCMVLNAGRRDRNNSLLLAKFCWQLCLVNNPVPPSLSHVNCLNSPSDFSSLNAGQLPLTCNPLWICAYWLSFHPRSIRDLKYYKCKAPCSRGWWQVEHVILPAECVWWAVLVKLPLPLLFCHYKIQNVLLIPPPHQCFLSWRMTIFKIIFKLCDNPEPWRVVKPPFPGWTSLKKYYGVWVKDTSASQRCWV